MLPKELEVSLKSLEVVSREGETPVTFSPPESCLPHQRVDGRVIARNAAPGTARCYLEYKEIVNRGMNCIIQKGIRSQAQPMPSKRTSIAIKRPKYPSRMLTSEAILQRLVHRALITEGVVGAVPEVHDVFVFAGEVRFSMDWVEGVSCYDFLMKSLKKGAATFETNFLAILCQTAYILYSIQKHLYLDHRDMKLDNLWICERPVTYSIYLNGKLYPYSCPFQVVLLDFGFGCLGDETNSMILNLGNSVIPDVDPCPKEGRDLYHILNRMLEPPEFRESLPASLLDEFRGWMSPLGLTKHRVSHLETSRPGFALKRMTPAAVLAWCLR